MYKYHFDASPKPINPAPFDSAEQFPHPKPFITSIYHPSPHPNRRTNIPFHTSPISSPTLNLHKNNPKNSKKIKKEAMSREAYNPPTVQQPIGGSFGSSETIAGPVTQYLCGDCNSKVQLKKGDPIRCKECGHRVLYKERTTRYVIFLVVGEGGGSILSLEWEWGLELLISLFYWVLGRGLREKEEFLGWNEGKSIWGV